MILPIQRQVQTAITDAIRRTYGLAEVPPFTVEIPPNRAMGDLAVTVAFQLARGLRKAPRVIAREIADAVGTLPGVERFTPTSNGYLNLYIQRETFVLDRAAGRAACLPVAEGKTI